MNSNQPGPPRRAERFLEWFVRDELCEEVLGDLEEKFFQVLEEKSLAKARRNYWFQVFNYLRPFAIRRTKPSYSNNYAMFKNYYTVAWRNLFKYKMYSFIKIGGFALGIAACLLISIYIKDEMSYDKAVANSDRTFRLINTYSEHGNVERWPAFQAPIKKVLIEDFPEVEMAGRLIPYDWYDGGSNQVRKVGEIKNMYEDGFVYGDPELIEILDINVIEGDRKTALKDLNSILISESKAQKLFPNENPVGQLIILNENKEKPYKIGGVMTDRPANSHLQFDFMISLSGVEFWNGEQTSWCCSNYNPYVRLKSGADPEAFEEKLSSIRDKYLVPYLKSINDVSADETQEKQGLEIQPVEEIHLYSQGIHDVVTRGDIQVIWIFGTVAFFILLLACVNFVNLSTAKSANRAKEVGLRKVIGSHKSHLIKQFLTESVLFSIISFVLGIILAELFLPYFNTLADKTMSFPWSEFWFIPTLIGLSLLIGIMAGVYPSFYLSAFKPVDVLKGSISRGAKSSGLQNAMVVFQFTTSVVLIIGAIVVNRQMDFILNTKIGFEKDHVVLFQGTNTLAPTFDVVKNELIKLPEVENVTISNYLPISGTRRDQNGFWNEGMTETEKSIGAQIWFVEQDYIPTLGMNLIKGRNFDEDLASDSSAIIINESMAKEFGFEDPIGKRITNNYMPTFTVIGVVEDFHYESVKGEIRPLSLTMGKYGDHVPIKIKTDDLPATMEAITGSLGRICA